MSQTETLYRELVADLTKSTTLGSCAAVLGWEEQTYLPPGGTENRANQLSLLAGMCHEISTSPRRGELLSALEESGELGDENSALFANVRESRHAYNKATKLPMELVQELSKTSSLGQAAWVEARKQNNFSQFLPWLEKIVKLKIEQAEAIGYGDGVPYDALLDDFEPGATTAEVKAIFDPLREELVQLVSAIKDSGKEPDVGIIEREYPIDAQQQFATKAATEIGFNFDEGRLDVAAHPFCSGFGPGDCRITTRYDAHHFPGAFFGVLHEAGHGMYEQGLNREAYGTPVGEACSLGIHESQSRMWENFVGRSRAFWKHFYADAQQAFPTALSDVNVDSFYAAVNDVRPSYIRVEADEVTYNLHIMLRFELEQALVTGKLKPTDVPGAWNEAFGNYFGMTPPDDAKGCLQDIHWSGGMIGYFPTYALGNIYAAQFFNKAEEDLGDLNEQFARGEFQPLKEWLNKNIHQRGQQYRATRLVEVVTGHSLDSKPLVKQLKAKFLPLYGLG